MKKKLASIALVLMFVVCLPVAALADSPVAALPATVDVSGSTLPAGATLHVNSVSTTVVSDFSAAKTELGITGTLMSVVDITMTGASGSATIKVNCPGLHANGAVVVIHQKADGTFETLPATCGEGFFTFTATSFSPFGFVLQNAGSASGGSSSTPTSPRTGVYEL